MSTPTILDKIKAYKLEHIAACKAERPYEDVAAQARALGGSRGFYDRLKDAATNDYGCLLYTSPSPRD